MREMIEVYIIEELERQRRKRERREQARIWISDPEDEPRVERERVVNDEPPRVIVIDL